MSDANNSPDKSKVKTMLITSFEDATSKIQERINKGRELRQIQVNNTEQFENLNLEFKKWDGYNSLLLKQLFTTEEISNGYENWGIELVSINLGRIDHRTRRLKDQLKLFIDQLEVIQGNLELYKEDNFGKSNFRTIKKYIVCRTLPTIKKIKSWLENHTGHIIASLLTGVLILIIKRKLNIDK